MNIFDIFLIVSLTVFVCTLIKLGTKAKKNIFFILSLIMLLFGLTVGFEYKHLVVLLVLSVVVWTIRVESTESNSAIIRNMSFLFLILLISIVLFLFIGTTFEFTNTYNMTVLNSIGFEQYSFEIIIALIFYSGFRIKDV